MYLYTDLHTYLINSILFCIQLVFILYMSVCTFLSVMSGGLFLSDECPFLSIKSDNICHYLVLRLYRGSKLFIFHYKNI